MLEKKGGGFTTREGVPVEIEKSILRTPVYATDFTRYSFRPKASEQVIFPYEISPDRASLMSVKTLSTKYPKAYAYLLSKRRALQRRKQFATWYSFSAPRNLVVHETANILVPLLANRGLLCELDGDPSSYCLMAGGAAGEFVLLRLVLHGTECGDVTFLDCSLGIAHGKLDGEAHRQPS